MTDEQKAAFVNSQAVCAAAEIAGMQAENAHRVSVGQSIAYGYEAFTAIPNQFSIGHNDVVGLFRS